MFGVGTGFLPVFWTSRNASGARIVDVETGEEIEHVLSVNTEVGEVECTHSPVRLKQNNDEIDSFKVKFRTIYPIFGLECTPQLFHCYGRQP